MLIVVVLFAIPRQLPNYKQTTDTGQAKALLDWQSIHNKFPWSVLFLLGGGFSIAQASKVCIL